LKRKISLANYDSPSDVQQLDAESPDNGRPNGFYDEEYMHLKGVTTSNMTAGD
jgi:hypothetical protein